MGLYGFETRAGGDRQEKQQLVFYKEKKTTTNIIMAELMPCSAISTDREVWPDLQSFFSRLIKAAANMEERVGPARCREKTWASPRSARLHTSYVLSLRPPSTDAPWPCSGISHTLNGKTNHPKNHVIFLGSPPLEELSLTHANRAKEMMVLKRTVQCDDRLQVYRPDITHDGFVSDKQVTYKWKEATAQDKTNRESLHVLFNNKIF